MQKVYLLLVVSLVIAGCTSGGSETVSSETPFIGGTGGLILNFLENAPPKEVTDKGRFPFDIIVMLDNQGEYTVPRAQAKVTISGLFPGDFGNIVLKNQIPDDDLVAVKKDSEGNKIPGAKTQVLFKGLNYGGTLDGNIKFPLRAEICYPYQTRATSLYCIRENLLETDTGVCKVSEPKTVHNSGAPVQVSSFTESVAGQSTVLFNFKVTQVGNGNVFKVGSNCDTSTFLNENRVKVTVESGLDGLTCLGLFDRAGSQNSGFVQLSNGEATFTCTQRASGFDAVKSLRVTLDYDYFETKSTTLLVKHLPE